MQQWNIRRRHYQRNSFGLNIETRSTDTTSLQEKLKLVTIVGVVLCRQLKHVLLQFFENGSKIFLPLCEVGEEKCSSDSSRRK